MKYKSNNAKFVKIYNADSENQSNTINLCLIVCTMYATNNHIATGEPARTGGDASKKNAVNATLKSIGKKFNNKADGTMNNAGTTKYI